jgi:hypothetical protein
MPLVWAGRREKLRRLFYCREAVINQRSMLAADSHIRRPKPLD